MIARKNNIIKLLDDIKSLTYIKEITAMDVGLKENEYISIKCYSDKGIDNNFSDYKNGISMLYKDRKD
ncbi:MAG: hypothetical protein N2B06_09445 [Clostridium sp.]